MRISLLRSVQFLRSTQPLRDFFALYNAPYQFNVDLKALSAQKRRMLFNAHPDRHPSNRADDVASSGFDTAFAHYPHLPTDPDDACSLISDAYEALVDPVLRACHIVSLAGLDGAALTHHRPSPDDLCRLLDCHEAIDDIVAEHHAGTDENAAAPMGHNVLSSDVAYNAKVSTDGLAKLAKLKAPLMVEKAGLLDQIEEYIRPFADAVASSKGPVDVAVTPPSEILPKLAGAVVVYKMVDGLVKRMDTLAACSGVQV